MESDPTISANEKALMFREWFTKDFSTMASCGFSPSDFETMVRESRLLFRRGTAEMFVLAQRNQLPVYVLSAGITEIIQNSFDCLDVDHTSPESQVRIISNVFKYKDGRTHSFEDLVTPDIKSCVLYDRH